jgi:hypothetical protein
MTANKNNRGQPSSLEKSEETSSAAESIPLEGSINREFLAGMKSIMERRGMIPIARNVELKTESALSLVPKAIQVHYSHVTTLRCSFLQLHQTQLAF